MSAICGVVGTDGRPFSPRDLGGVVRELRPLGRGEEATWSGTVGRAGVALGACGAGAMARAGDDALCIVADAALDCRADLKAALRPRGGARSSDAELILAAYERWGEACVERLSGEFAFALADARRGGVLVARDQIGARPLQIHRRRGVVAFATTALSLCALEGVGHELDVERVGEWLALQADTARTFVAGVTALPASHSAWIGTDGIRQRRYWDLDPDRIVELGDPAEYAARLRAATDSAVARRLPDAEPPGVLLSGGLDSASVAATAARLRPRDVIRTYTSAPRPGWNEPALPNQDADESALVRELAARYPSLRPSFLAGDHGPLLSHLDTRFAAGSPPPRNPCNELWIAAVQRRAAADGVGTLLTGTRGNAFFSGDDPFWLAELLARGRGRALARELAALGAPTATRELVRQLLPARALRMRETAKARRAGIAARDELHFAGRGTERVVRLHARFELPSRTSLRSVLLRLVVPSGGFAAEAARVRDALAGIHMSDPTSDVRVIEVCATQPPWARRRDGRTRAVVRDAMADRLPPSIAERTRRGAQLPDWFELMTARRGELVEELAAARDHERCRELLDLEGIDRALREWPDPRSARARWQRTTRVYRYDLLRALLLCRYLRFFEAHAGVDRGAR